MKFILLCQMENIVISGIIKIITSDSAILLIHKNKLKLALRRPGLGRVRRLGSVALRPAAGFRFGLKGEMSKT